MTDHTGLPYNNIKLSKQTGVNEMKYEMKNTGIVAKQIRVDGMLVLDWKCGSIECGNQWATTAGDGRRGWLVGDQNNRRAYQTPPRRFVANKKEAIAQIVLAHKLEGGKAYDDSWTEEAGLIIH